MKKYLRPSLLDFERWLQEKAETHERLVSTGKSKPETSSTAVTKNKIGTKTFFSNANASGGPIADKRQQETNKLPPCVCFKGKHALWKCSVFKEKPPTLRARLKIDFAFPV